MLQDEILQGIVTSLKNNGGQTKNIQEDMLDDFINRCVQEKGYSLDILHKEILWKLERGVLISFEEIKIFPQIINRIQERMNKGET